MTKSTARTTMIVLVAPAFILFVILLVPLSCTSTTTTATECAAVPVITPDEKENNTRQKNENKKQQEKQKVGDIGRIDAATRSIRASLLSASLQTKNENTNNEKQHVVDIGMHDAATRLIRASLVSASLSISNTTTTTNTDLLLKQQQRIENRQRRKIMNDIYRIFGTIFDRKELQAMIKQELDTIINESQNKNKRESNISNSRNFTTSSSLNSSSSTNHSSTTTTGENGECKCSCCSSSVSTASATISHDDSFDKNHNNVDQSSHMIHNEDTERNDGDYDANNDDYGDDEDTTLSSSLPASSQSRSSTSSSDDFNSNFKHTADRHAQGILDIVNDYDCLEREFDVSVASNNHNNNNNDDDDTAAALLVDAVVKVFQKCHLVVLRNVFSKATIDTVLPKYVQYIHAVDTGQISSTGTTTFGGEYFILKEDTSRYNYMITKDLVQQSSAIFAQNTILNILSHPTILGDNMILNHVGSINAQPPSQQQQQQQQNHHSRRRHASSPKAVPPQYWHFDGDYIPNIDDEEQRDYNEVGIAGHDIYPYAINMFTPINMNLTSLEYGPTEFCLGSSHLRGHDFEHDLPVSDRTVLTAKEGIVEQLQEFEWYVDNGGGGGGPPPECPKGLTRTPLLNRGDVILFDYMLTHRGGANTGTQLRSLLFGMYSRKWYRDTTFDMYYGNNNEDDDEKSEEEIELEHLMKLTRFAVVQEGNNVNDDNDNDDDDD